MLSLYTNWRTAIVRPVAYISISNHKTECLRSGVCIN
jgi:hypothetical protein